MLIHDKRALVPLSLEESALVPKERIVPSRMVWRSPSLSARRAPMAEADLRKVDRQKPTMENDTRMENW